MEIKLILCPIDFSEFSIRAYHYAVSVAQHYRARLVAQHIVEFSRYPYAEYVASTGDYAAFCRGLRDGGKQKLSEFVSAHTHGEIEPELEVHDGAAPDCILLFAQERKTDLIVMGTHGRRGFDRLVLGSVTDRVMRRAPCPVLVISNLPNESTTEGRGGQHVHHLNRILFCTDFSENSERALSYAISVTEEYDAELILLHVLEPVPSPAKTKIAVVRATELLDKLIPPGKRKTLNNKSVVRTGKPYQQIIQLVREAQIDMVVMGVRGRGTLDQAVFGSTTYRTLQLGSCPVLVVPIYP